MFELVLINMENLLFYFNHIISDLIRDLIILHRDSVRVKPFASLAQNRIKCLKPQLSAVKIHSHTLPHMYLSHNIIQSIPPEIQSRPNAPLLRFILQPPATLSLLHQPPASAWRKITHHRPNSNIRLPIDYEAGLREIDFFKLRQR